MAMGIGRAQHQLISTSLDKLIPTEACEQSISVERVKALGACDVRVASSVPVSVKRMRLNRPNEEISRDVESGLYRASLEPQDAVIVETKCPPFPVARIIAWSGGESARSQRSCSTPAEVRTQFTRAKSLTSTGASIALARAGLQLDESDAKSESGCCRAALLRARRN